MKYIIILLLLGILGWITHIFIYLRIYRSKKWFLFEDSIVDYNTIANEYFKDTGENPYYDYMYKVFGIKSFWVFYINRSRIINP